MKDSFLYKSIKDFSDFSVKSLSSLLPEWKPAKSHQMLEAVSGYVPTLPVNSEQLPEYFAAYFRETIHSPERQLYVLKDAYVSWHTVVFKNLKIFLPALAIAHWKDFYDNTYLLKQWFGNGVPATDSDEPVALVHDQWTRGNYYHWMIDALSRLLALREQYPDVLLLMPQPTSAYVQQTALLLGFARFVPVSESQVVKAHTLLVPEHVAAPGFHNPSILRQLRAEITSKLFPAAATPVPTRRVYVSRSRQQVRRLHNEAALLALLQPHGFETVFFEGMSFIEQVALMQSTAVLVGVHGANLVNLLFLQAGARVVELINEDKFTKLGNANFENLIYYRMSSTLELPYYAVPCKTIAGQQPSNDADVEVDLKDVELIVQQLTAAR